MTSDSTCTAVTGNGDGDGKGEGKGDEDKDNGNGSNSGSWGNEGTIVVTVGAGEDVGISVMWLGGVEGSVRARWSRVESTVSMTDRSWYISNDSRGDISFSLLVSRLCGSGWGWVWDCSPASR